MLHEPKKEFNLYDNDINNNITTYNSFNTSSSTYDECSNIRNYINFEYLIKFHNLQLDNNKMIIFTPQFSFTNVNKDALFNWWITHILKSYESAPEYDIQIDMYLKKHKVYDIYVDFNHNKKKSKKYIFDTSVLYHSKTDNLYNSEELKKFYVAFLNYVYY